MPYVRNRFIDPAAVVAAYSWEANHTEEEDTQLRRNFEHTATTNGFGLVRQQGDESPLVFKFSGTITRLNQIQKMLLYYQLCRTQSIHFRDFEGHKYEVLITAFNYKRVKTIRNPRDPNILLHYYTYSIEIEAMNFLGDDFS